MKEKQNRNVIILIAIILIIAVLAVVYFITRNEQVKSEQESYKNKADELKRRITEKESAISALIYEIDRLRQFDAFLTEQARQIYKSFKLAVFMLLGSLCLVLFVMYSFEFFKGLLTCLGIAGLTYKCITIYFQNKIGDFNNALKLLEDYFITREYSKYSFQPCAIGTLELRLASEQNELQELMKQHQLCLADAHAGSFEQQDKQLN